MRSLSIILVVFCFFLFVGNTRAQDEKPRLLTTNHSLFGLTSVSLIDNYISNLEYQGYGFGFRNTSRKLLGINHPHWSWVGDLSWNMGTTSNNPGTASIYYVMGNVGLGMQRRFLLTPKLCANLGGLWDVDLAYRQTSRDINNLSNGDVSTNLNLAATFWLTQNVMGKPVRFSLDVRSPLLGCMLVPELGASYYEIMVLENSKNFVHFSSLHNKNGLRAQFLTQIPAKRIRFDFGLEYDMLNYLEGGVHIFRKNWSLQAGLSYDFRIFGGKRNKAPASLITPEEW
jgi:hypothetical protein